MKWFVKQFHPIGKSVRFRGVVGYHVCLNTEGPRFETGRKHAFVGCANLLLNTRAHDNFRYNNDPMRELI